MNKPLALFTTIILALSHFAHVEGDTSEQNITGILGGESGEGFARAVEPIDLCVSQGSRTASRLQNRVVVLYGQPENGYRERVRLSTHLFPKGAGGEDACPEIAPGEQIRFTWRTSP